MRKARSSFYMVRAAAAILGVVASTSTLATTADGVLNVHVVCHTHDDAGWLKTADQYYVGANNSIQHAGVQFILNSVVASLLEDPTRRFVYAEQAFLWRWWRQQDIRMRHRVAGLVRDGRLSFINGGWVMHDEACAHYTGMIDQTTLGHQFIARTFGPAALPNVAWQIDPFGHSATQASLLGGAAGYDALFFGRIDYGDREKRLAESALEMVWRSSPSMGSSAELFAGAFQSGNYGAPAGMCFDVLCSDDPVQDDPELEGYDAPARLEAFVSAALEQAKSTRGSHIMLTMGSDFTFESADEWFHSLDRVLRLASADGRVAAFYSTPAQYVAAKHAERIDWGPVKTDDFFPYADGPHSYWTGYYSSRPALKRQERVAGGFLQAARQLQFLAAARIAAVGLNGHDDSGGSGDNSYITGQLRAGRSLQAVGKAVEEEPTPVLPALPVKPVPALPGLQRLERAHALVQHHDGVSGTSKQHVAYDYSRRLAAGVAEAGEVAGAALEVLLGWNTATYAAASGGSAPVTPLRRLQWCPLLNESRCDATEHLGSGGGGGGSVTVVVYNPLGDMREETLLLPVGGAAGVVVTDSAGGAVESQLLPLSGGVSRYAAAFPVVLGPLGTAAFTVRVDATAVTASVAAAAAAVREAEGAPAAAAPVAVTLGADSEADEAAAAVRTLRGASLRAPDLPVEKKDFSIENEWMKLDFSGETGRLTGVWRTLPDGGSSVFVAVDQGFASYQSYDGRKEAASVDAASAAPVAAAAAAEAAADLSVLRHHELKERLFDANPQNGGAYIMRPLSSASAAVGARDEKGDENDGKVGRAVSWEVVRGPLVSEVRQVFSPWCSQVVRLRRGQMFAEFEWAVGPIPVEDGIGREVVSRFKSAVASKATWWTDSNGREFLQRHRNARETWKLNVTEPVAGNFYPITTAAFIRDSDSAAESPLQLSVLTDRAQGVASLADGELEFLVHRRLLADDDRGVAEPLNETTGGIGPFPRWERRGSGLAVKGTHLLHVAFAKSALSEVRPLMDRAYAPVLTAFSVDDERSRGESDMAVAATAASGVVAGLTQPLPANVQLVTLKLLSSEAAATFSGRRRGDDKGSATVAWENNCGTGTAAPVSALLRLAHRYAVGEDPEGGLSAKVEVLLDGLLAGLRVADAVELMLTAARPLEGVRRLNWRVTEGAGAAGEAGDGGEDADSELEPALRRLQGEGDGAWVVSIAPMEIRTVLLCLCTASSV